MVVRRVVVRRPARRFAAVLAVVGLGSTVAWAQQASEPEKPVSPPGLAAAPAPFKPDGEEAQPDVWIFSGELGNSRETFSGTLVAGKAGAQFELKLAGGATCDGSNISGDVGLVRLGEITCSDDRVMRALFVPQGGQELKVFGHVADERFTASAHLLGTEAVPDKKQTAEPTVPKLQGAPDASPPKP